MKYTEDELIEMLREAELKITDRRLDVLRRIAKSKTPISSHKLIEDCKRKLNIDQATVYRNLTSLEEADLIKRFDYNHGHAHYEMKMSDVNHRIICSKCETIEKIGASYLEESMKKLIKKSKKFNNLSTSSAHIYSTCKNCQ
jgi:Fur family ferric uptake transcriptional regulator